MAIPLLPVVEAVVPLSTEPPGFTAMLRVTVTPETPLPLASVTSTLIAGVICDQAEACRGNLGRVGRVRNLHGERERACCRWRSAQNSGAAQRESGRQRAGIGRQCKGERGSA